MKFSNIVTAHKGVRAAIGMAAMAYASIGFSQTAKPADLKVGITTYMSGSASVFGVPAKAAAEQWIADFNANGGINGVKITPVFIDEGLGGDKLLTEYRRAVQEQGVKVMLSAISSGNCNIVAPVAEDLKVLNVMWDCGTEKVLEDRQYKYVARSTSNAVTEMVATVVYLLKVKPDLKTIAVVNQDYAWGHDSWEIFRNALNALKPGVRVVAEMFPKFGAADFSTEISRLQALKPDVILSTSWGGDLDTFVRQSSQRGLFKTSQFVLPLAESSLERLGAALPDGVIVGGRGDPYFLNPEYKSDPKFKAFVEKFRVKTGAYPIYPVFHMVQGLEAVTGAYKVALESSSGQWPTTDQLAAAVHGLSFRGLTRPVHIRKDGQGLEDQLLGMTTHRDGYSFKVLGRMMIVPADLVTTPGNVKSIDWIKTLKPSMLADSRIKVIAD